MKENTKLKEKDLNLLTSTDETRILADLEQIQTKIWESNGKYLPDTSLFKAMVNLGRNHKSVRVRTEVASLLGFLLLYEDKRVVKPLVDLAQDRHREVRAEGVAGMDSYMDGQFEDALVKALRDRTEKVRMRAIVSTYAPAGTSGERGDFRMAPQLVTELLRFLQSEDRKFREMALHALRHARAKSVLPHVVKLLGKSKNLSERLSAILILGSIKDRLALETLTGLLQTERSFRGKKIAIRELGNLGYKQAIRPLKKIADDEGLDRELRDAALVSVIRLGDSKTVTRLEEDFRKGGFEERGRLVNVAAMSGKRECQSILRKGLSHGNVTVASNAAHALAKLGDRRALPVLLMELNPDNHLGCADAVVSLGILGDRKAVGHLIEIYDEFEGGESLVIEALGRLGGKEAVGFLRKLSRTEKRVVYRDQISGVLERFYYLE